MTLGWNPTAGASTYRIFRRTTADAGQQIAETADSALVDTNLMNGTGYLYSVVAVGADGLTSAESDACTAIPSLVPTGDPPPAVAAASCRPKNDKVDVTWAAVAEAAYYKVSRSVDGAPAVEVGSVLNPVYADFGLEDGVSYGYTVVAVSATGAEAAASTACFVNGDPGGPVNRPPTIVYGRDVRPLRLSSVDDIIALKESGVSEEAIQAIIQVAGERKNEDYYRSWEMLENMNIEVDVGP